MEDFFFIFFATWCWLEKRGTLGRKKEFKILIERQITAAAGSHIIGVGVVSTRCVSWLLREERSLSCKDAEKITPIKYCSCCKYTITYPLWSEEITIVAAFYLVWWKWRWTCWMFDELELEITKVREDDRLPYSTWRHETLRWESYLLSFFLSLESLIIKKTPKQKKF